jgi:hypothetical protein
MKKSEGGIYVKTWDLSRELWIKAIRDKLSVLVWGFNGD